MAKSKHYSAFLLSGAGAYWLPDIATRYLCFYFSLPSTGYVASLTFLVPLVVLVAYFYLRKILGKESYPFGLPLFMLLGIWFFGPLGMAIGTIPEGGTFLKTENLMGFFGTWALFPITTWIMSAYSMSLGGLSIITISLISLAFIAFIKKMKSKCSQNRNAVVHL